MGQPSLAGSSSPEPTTTSSQSSMSTTERRRTIGDVQYRYKEVVDRDCNRISETARRRRPQGSLTENGSSQNSSILSDRVINIEALHTRPTPPRQSPIIHQGRSSPDDKLSLQPRIDSFVEISALARENWHSISRKPSEALFKNVELSPPPTPRFQRLPTPDLEPLKVSAFCDCQGCAMWDYPDERCRTWS